MNSLPSTMVQGSVYSPDTTGQRTLTAIAVDKERVTITADYDVFERKVKIYFLGIWRTLTALFFLMSLTMLIVGSIFVNNCEGGRFIPIYLILSGVIGTLHFIIMLRDCCRAKPKRGLFSGGNYRLLQAANCLFAVFLGWTFFGSIPILKLSIQTDDPNKAMYCHKIPFAVSFYMGAMLDVLYIVLFITGFLVLCACGLLSPDGYPETK